MSRQHLGLEQPRGQHRMATKLVRPSPCLILEVVVQRSARTLWGGQEPL